MRWDPVAREFQCAVALYKDAATAADSTKAPLVAEFARFRLSGASFDARLSKAVIAAAEVDMIALVYASIKEVCEAAAEDEITNMAEYIKCDGGRAFYDDATDV